MWRQKLGTSCCCSRCCWCGGGSARTRDRAATIQEQNTFSRRTAELLKGWGIQSANAALLKNDFSVCYSHSGHPNNSVKKTSQKIPTWQRYCHCQISLDMIFLMIGKTFLFKCFYWNFSKQILGGTWHVQVWNLRNFCTALFVFLMNKKCQGVLIWMWWGIIIFLFFKNFLKLDKDID